MKLLIVAALVALAAAEPPSSYGAPARSQSGGYNSNSNSGGYNSNSNAGGYNSNSQQSGGVLSGGRTANIRQGGAIESESDLRLEDEGLLLPSEIVGQDLLDRVVDALSEELAQQEAARAATSSAYGPPGSNGGYGPPSNAYGAPAGRDNGAGLGRIQLLIPPDPLKAKLIANYIQRTTGDYVGGQNSNNQRGGGYDNGGYN